MRPLVAATLPVVAVTLVTACSKPALVAKPERPAHALLVTDVAVLDVESGGRTEHQDVLVRAGRIAEIGAAGTVKAPAATTTIDGAGATLLPGLVDSHVHTGTPPAPPWEHPMPDAEANLRAYLYAGVTTVLDTGGLDDEALRNRDLVAKGKLLGPRIYAVGPVVTTKGGHPVPMLETLPWWQRVIALSKQTRQVSDAEDVRKAITQIHGYGADFVKVAVDSIPAGTPRISDELLDEVGRAAKSRGIRMIAHVGTTEDALDAGRAGASAWVHGVYRERIPDEKIAELAKLDIPMVPTLVVFRHYAELLKPPYAPTALERETVAAETLEALNAPPEGAAPQAFREYFELLAAQQDAAKENVRRLHEAGVTILAGSDTHAAVFPGAALHRELALLVEAGLTPADAIRAATLSPARFLTRKQEPEFGRIAIGTRADLLLVEGDPTADIANVSRIRAVIRDGRHLERMPLVAPAEPKTEPKTEPGT